MQPFNKPIPTLQTERLTLRPFQRSDAPDVQRLAGDWELARTTATVPHPYEDGVAEAWIASHAQDWTNGVNGVWAFIRHEDDALIGCINLELNQQLERGEIGYWVGRPYWGQGYCTEAARVIVDYGFAVLNLHRIQARHSTINPASGRIMEKIGMTFEGTLRDYYRRWDTWHSISFHSILHTDRS